MMTFIELAASGRAEDEEIDEFVEMWHKSPDIDCPIFVFLGMSEEEYAAWALDPDVLPHIITAHQTGINFRTTLEGVYEQRLAARSDSLDKLVLIQSWLDQNT